MNKFRTAFIAPVLVLASSLNANQLYTIENQSLKEAIEQISKKSNMPYMVNGKILEGKKASNIKNIKGVKNALKKILKGTNLEATIEKGTILIKNKKVKNNSSKYNLGEVDIVASTKEGLASEGYLVKNTNNIGIWKGDNLQDVPYSLNIMSEEFIKNLQSTSTDQLYNVNPVMQMTWNQSQNNNGYVFLRGFSTSTSAIDGMRREKWQHTHNTNVEEYEKLETITGLSGFLYGPSFIGGIRNFISKRPTPSSKYEITLGNAGGENGYYAHADLSSSLTKNGKLAYRLNIVNQDIDTHVENQKLQRKVFNLGLDYKITDNILFQGMISNSNYRLDGRQPYWFLSKGAIRPDASKIDSNKLWGQKWAYQESNAKRYSTNFLWNISDSIDFRAAYMNEKVTREGIYTFNNIEVDGTYSQTISNDTGIEQNVYGYGAYAFIDYSFETYSTQHQLSIGMQKSDSHWSRGNVDTSNSTIISKGFNLDYPTYINAPQVSKVKSINDNIYHLASTNYTIGDSIEFTPKWKLLVGASYVELEYKDNNYKESTITPSVSVVYKPIENLSLYGSYMEGIEIGGVAKDKYGGYDVINAKKAMKPLMSDQIEIGAKYTFNNILFTAALFEIDKGLEYYDITNITEPVFVQDGRQVHRGFEFTTTGRITDNLTAIGGFTLLDAKVKRNKANPTLEGKRPNNVADKFAKLYLEYSPFNNLDLSLNTGINYTASFYGDNLNTDRLPSYTLVNLGTKYTTKTTTHPLTFRLNVNNAFDKRYWINSRYLGDRRTLHASVSMKF